MSEAAADRSPLTDAERDEIDRHLQRDPDADRALLEDAIRRRRGRDHPEAERIREDWRAALGEPEAIKAKLQRLRDNPPPASTWPDDRPEPDRPNWSRRRPCWPAPHAKATRNRPPGTPADMASCRERRPVNPGAPARWSW